jgi:Cu2+-containing amine oxidase
MSKRILILASAMLCLGLVAAGNAQRPEPRQLPPSERAALDPLTAEEEAMAVRIARADGRVKEALAAENVRVVSVVPVLMKRGESHEKLDLHQREIEVTLFQPQKEVGARVVVNLRQNSVASVQRLAAHQVPFTSDDLNDAFQLALRDPQVQRALGESAQSFHVQGQRGVTAETAATANVVTGLPLRSSDPNDPCSKDRCLQLLFRRGNDFLSEPVVTVNLSKKQVVIERRHSQ